MADRLQHPRRAVTVHDIGRVDHREKHQAERIGDDVVVASLGHLARVEAANPAILGGFHGLRVVHTRHAAGLAPLQIRRAHDQQQSNEPHLRSGKQPASACLSILTKLCRHLISEACKPFIQPLLQCRRALASFR